MLLSTLKDLLKAAVSPPRHPAEGKLATRNGPTSSDLSITKEEAECRRTLDSLPNSAEAHNKLGALLKDTSRLAEAEAAFRRAISLHGDNVVAHYNLGIVLAETNRPLEAEVEYRSALKLLPNFVEAHNNLGVVLLQAKRPAEADAAFHRALELKPDFVDAQKNLGIALAEIERLAEVEAHCRRALDLMPNSAEAHNNLGMLLKDTKRLTEAEAAFRRAINLQGDNVVALHNLGIILAETNRPWEAEAAYRSALHLQPDDADAHNNLGFVLLNTGRLAEAEAAFRRATTTRPDHEAARRNLDFALREIKRITDAEAACRRDAALRPGRATSHYRLGCALLAWGKLGEAVASFKKALAIEPNYAHAHNGLGIAFMRQQQVEDAIACCLQAISIRPDFAKAMANLAAAYYAKNELQQAVTWNQAALAIEPHQIEANRNMALILRSTGHEDEGKRYSDRASRRPPVYVEYGADPVRTVLLIWTQRKGNVPTVEFLFPATINTRINWVIESAHDDKADDLPDYDLVFNAMGDPDMVGDCIEPLARFTELCSTPLLNHPAKVARTARDKVPTLLDGIDNILVPAVWRFAGSNDWEQSMADQLPVLIRPVDSHGGTGLVLARTVDELEQCKTAQSGPVYVCRFIDFRSTDSWFRKYRIIFVDRRPYPYHLAISANWMVHYYTADMEAYRWKLEEEKVFLERPDAVLGPVGMEAIRSIGARMDLDYCGIDFSIMADRRILVFEANPLMLVHPEDISGPLAHKNEYTFRIQSHFEELLGKKQRFTS